MWYSWKFHRDPFPTPLPIRTVEGVSNVQHLADMPKSVVTISYLVQHNCIFTSSFLMQRSHFPMHSGSREPPQRYVQHLLIHQICNDSIEVFVHTPSRTDVCEKFCSQLEFFATWNVEVLCSFCRWSTPALRCSVSWQPSAPRLTLTRVSSNSSALPLSPSRQLSSSSQVIKFFPLWFATLPLLQSTLICVASVVTFSLANKISWHCPVYWHYIVMLLTVASLIPISKGIPRRGGKEMGGIPFFTSDAELINGRCVALSSLQYLSSDDTHPELFLVFLHGYQLQPYWELLNLVCLSFLKAMQAEMVAFHNNFDFIQACRCNNCCRIEPAHHRLILTTVPCPAQDCYDWCPWPHHCGQVVWRLLAVDLWCSVYIESVKIVCCDFRLQ